MKHLNLYLAFFFINFIFIAQSQSLIIPEQHFSYTINELIIKDSSFLSTFDSLVFEKKCPKIKDMTYSYFIMKIEKKNDECIYEIGMEADEKPYIDENAMGYFVLNNYYFFVYGCNPNNIFTITPKKKQFNYKTDEELPYIEEFPYWIFNFSDNKLTLVDYYCW